MISTSESGPPFGLLSAFDDLTRTDPVRLAAGLRPFATARLP